MSTPRKNTGTSRKSNGSPQRSSHFWKTVMDENVPNSDSTLNQPSRTDQGNVRRAVVRRDGQIQRRSGGERFTCSTCSTNFKRKYDLVQHINAVHEKLKPHLCTVCNQAFAHKGTLSKHIRTVHMREKPFICEHCDQRFSERGNLNKHQQRAPHCRAKESEKEKRRSIGRGLRR